MALNQRVLGSSPSASTKIPHKINGLEQAPEWERNLTCSIGSA